MAEIPTVKVKRKSDGWEFVMNECDFDEAVYEKVQVRQKLEAPPAAKPAEKPKTEGK
jgi:hypothetical protein